MLYARTLLARNPSLLLEHISHLPPSLKSHPLLYTPSLSIPADALSPLVSALSTFSTTANIGCLSAPLPGHAHDHTCALAVFDAESAVPFRSTIPGRTQAQVGKWHQMREGVRGDEGKGDRWKGVEDVSKEDVDWEDVWGRTAGDDQLPPELRHLNPEDVHTVLTLTDNAPQGLNNALSAFPNASKLGMIAASTPFVTGRPYTLLHNASVHSSGAVGIALTRPSAPPSLQTDFPGLKPITDVLTVTKSEGNLVHELDASNPSKLLLDAISSRGLTSSPTKEHAFFLGVLQGDPAPPTHHLKVGLWADSVWRKKCSQMYHIMSGDPSRGTIALESDAAPEAGTRVRLFHRSPRTPISLSLPGNTQVPRLAFVNAAQDGAGPEKEEAAGVPQGGPAAAGGTSNRPKRVKEKGIWWEVIADEKGEMPTSKDKSEDPGKIRFGTDEEKTLRALQGDFVSASENGFVCSRARGGEPESERAWTCTVAGGTARLTWDAPSP